MRFSTLSMKGTTHIRCKVGVLAAFLAHPKYQSNEELIREAKNYILGNYAKWAYAFHLPKEEAFEVLSKCLPEITRRQQSSGMWKRKNADIYTYGILRALKHAGLLEQDIFRYDLYQSFRKKNDLISILIRKNIINETNINVEYVVAEIFSTQTENGSWYNSLSATCFQLQILSELGINTKHESVSSAIKWLFEQFHEKFEGKARTWRFDFENIFLPDNYAAEQKGFQQVAPEHGKMGCFSSLLSGTGSFIIGNPAITTAIALYTLTKLGYRNDKRILDSYENLYNIRGFAERNGKINEFSWCNGVYKPNSVRYDLNRTGISFDDYLQIVKERKTKK
ncbi:MAG: hypothetical protein ACFE75_03765 [Candidatus Hodarchaeota archaeon]